MPAPLTPLLGSLRARLILALFSVAILGAVGMMTFTELDRFSASDALEDTSLPMQARDLLHGLTFDRAGRLARVREPGRWRQAYARPGAAYFTVFDAGGRPVARSPNLPTALQRLSINRGQISSPLKIVGSAQDLGLTVRAPHGYAVTVQRSNPGTMNEADPNQLSDFWPLLIFGVVIGVGAIAVWLMADVSLRSIRLASEEASRIGPANLDTRLSVENLPSEAKPLARAVNGALDRVNAAYAAEKRFTADAAHALRTPLAVMDLRLQRSETTGAVDTGVLRRDLKEIARIVGGLLTLANAEHGADRPRSGAPTETVNLARLLREQAAALLPLLDREERTISVEAPDALLVCGAARQMRDLVAALLENAIAHGRGAVSVILSRDGEGIAHLLVIDEGVGVSPAQWNSVFERFRKLDPASAGAGLGLSIVKSVATTLGGDAEFVAPATVRVRLPAVNHHP